MKQHVTIRNRDRSEITVSVPRVVQQFLPVAIFFAIAFAVDMLTGQRYSSVWGSAAIVASAIHLLPMIRSALATLGGYAVIWVGFNLVRAIADDTGLAVASTATVSGWERSLFGGTLPSVQFQTWFFDPTRVQMHDVILSLVHASFFVVPLVIAVIVWWRARPFFRPYAIATAASFALSLVGFLLLPTAPPWMSSPGEVTRVTPHVLAETLGVFLGSDEGAHIAGGFRFEPNHLAAMPSVHVSATVLVFLMLMRFGRLPGVIGGTYALLMTIGVVYLGEHFIIDAILGWVTAIIGWSLALHWLQGGKRPIQRVWNPLPAH